MNYTTQKDYATAKKNCPVGGTAFSCMPSVDNMRKGRNNKIGYVSGHFSASEIYLALNGHDMGVGNPCLTFHK